MAKNSKNALETQGMGLHRHAPPPPQFTLEMLFFNMEIGYHRIVNGFKPMQVWTHFC